MENELMNAINSLQKSVENLSLLVNKLAVNESDEKVKQAYDMFVKKDETAALDESLDNECPVDEKVFCEEKDVDDCSIFDLIPEQAKKWTDRLTISEMIEVLENVDKEEGFESEDEFISELVDQLKNMAIAKYTNDIKEGRISSIEDEEIKSEVVDYMTAKGYNIPTSLLPEQTTSREAEIKKAIERLDKGVELELEDDMLDAIVDYLWKTRNNVSIKIRNNKIKLS